MTGTILNTAAILVGGLIGLRVARQLSRPAQTRLRLVLTAFILCVGASMIWEGLRLGAWLRGTGGSFGGVVKQLGIALLALVLGNALGLGLRLQTRLDRLGEYLQGRLAPTDATADHRFSEGLVSCSMLFCEGPMAIIGALEDGVHGDFKILALKSVLDGLGALGFAATFGAGVLLAALPVLVYQGTLTLAAHALAQQVNDPVLLDSIRVTGGFVVLCISVVILELRKVPLANYLPSLGVAPLLTHWWR